jgi:hypothetical protein
LFGPGAKSCGQSTNEQEAHMDLVRHGR